MNLIFKEASKGGVGVYLNITAFNPFVVKQLLQF